MNVVARSLRHSIGVRRALRPPTCHAASTRPFRRAFATVTSTKLDKLVENLKASRDISSIRNSFSALVAEVVDFNHVSGPSVDDNGSMLSVLQSLAASGQPEDILIIDKILNDLSPVLGVIPSKSLYTSILQSYIENGHEEQAYNFLLNIPRLPQHFTPGIEQVHMILESCSRLDILTNLIAAINRLGIPPSSQTFVFIFLARSRIAKRDGQIPDLKETSKMITSCVRGGLTYDLVIVDILYDMFATGGRFSQAAAILDIYQSILNSTAGPNVTGSAKTNDITDPEADAQSTPPGASKPRATLFKYADALAIALESGNGEDALQIFTEGVKAGVTLVDNMMLLFVKAVTRDPSATEHLDKAIEISRMLADSVVPIPSSGVRVDKPYGPGLSIYHGLIRTLYEAPDTAKYTVVIQDLIDEMKSRGLPINTSVCATANIILDMRKTDRFKSSIETYHQFRPLLNEYGYVAILKEYCRISFAGNLQLPLVTEFFSIVQDMRFQRVPITNVVYNTFLNAIGKAATRVVAKGGDREMVLRLIDSTRRVHDFLTLDASIAPDATLWNQLMNTYQRLGCFADACRLWDTMYLSKRYNQISVNIMLDACGYARNLRLARSMMTKLQKSGFKLDLRNWNTWVECLCRCHRFKEAVEVVLVTIKEKGYQPDMQSVRVLLKFARRLPKEDGDTICSQLEEGLPQLWRRLPQELRNR